MHQLDENSIYSLLWRIMRANFIRSHELFEKHNVHPGQPPLLISLYMEDGQSQVQLAQNLQLKPSTITVMIRRLQKSGLVYRESDASDKRVSRIFLTNCGHDVCKELIKINASNEKICTQNMTTEEKIVLRRLLIQVLDNISQPINTTVKGDDSTC